MGLIEWDESLSVGVPSLDSQHQKLVNIINTLHEAMRAGHGKAALKKTLAEMQQYTTLHFATEERWLKVYKYPELEAQVAQHQKFINKLVEFQNDAESGALSTPVDVMNFLGDWLVRHIQTSDKKYAELLIKAGVP